MSTPWRFSVHGHNRVLSVISVFEMAKAPRPHRVLIVFNTPFLYGMERSVIETYDLLRPEIEPHFLLSYTTYRLNLPILKEIQSRNLSYTFFRDRQGWPTLGKPKSIKNVWELGTALISGNISVLKAALRRDSIYVPNVRYLYYAILAAFLYRISGKKVIYSCHDLGAPRLQLNLMMPLISAFRHNTNLSYQYFVRSNPGITKKVNYINPTRVDARVHTFRDPAIKTHFDGRRNILFIGQVSHHKGINILIEAIKLLADRYDDVRLHIVGGCGDPEYKKRFLDLIESENLKEKITYWGYRDDSHHMLEMSYIYAHPSPPSLFNESFGRGVVEAMVKSIPTVCFRSGALQEVVVHEKTGLICEDESPACLAGQLRRFLDDPEFRDRCGEAARRRFEQCYSDELVKEGWLKLISGKK